MHDKYVNIVDCKDYVTLSIVAALITVVLVQQQSSVNRRIKSAPSSYAVSFPYTVILIQVLGETQRWTTQYIYLSAAHYFWLELINAAFAETK